MKTEVKALAPADVGLSLTVYSGPRGSVEGDWPRISYSLQLMKDSRPVWAGEYHLGVGHVQKLSSAAVESRFTKPYLTDGEKSVARIYARGGQVEKTPEALQLEASLAAKLAAHQKVAPKLEDVCYSLLSDGSAYFDSNTFESWASDLGYDTDSIKAKETFEACDKIGRDLNRALTREELAGLREWAGNY